MKGAQVLAAHERPPVRDSEFQTNLNVTRSRRRLDAVDVAVRESTRLVRRRCPFHTGDGPCHFPGLRRVLRGSSFIVITSDVLLLLPRRGDAKGHDLDPVRITGSSVGDRCSYRDKKGATTITKAQEAEAVRPVLRECHGQGIFRRPLPRKGPEARVVLRRERPRVCGSTEAGVTNTSPRRGLHGGSSVYR